MSCFFDEVEPRLLGYQSERDVELVSFCSSLDALTVWNAEEHLGWTGTPPQPELCLRSSDKRVETVELSWSSAPE